MSKSFPKIRKFIASDNGSIIVFSLLAALFMSLNSGFHNMLARVVGIVLAFGIGGFVVSVLAFLLAGGTKEKSFVRTFFISIVGIVATGLGLHFIGDTVKEELIWVVVGTVLGGLLFFVANYY